MKAAMIRTEEGASFVLDGKPYDCSPTHANYQQVLEAARDKNWEAIPDLINIRSAINAFIGDSAEIVVEDDHIRYGDNIIHGTIVDDILTMIEEGFDAQPMINFIKNLYKNPSFTAINELYEFLVSSKLPITEDGCFLAYKRVNKDYTSIHDGRFKNDIGTQPAMERSRVDDNRNNTCSQGLHFCSYSYLASFGGARTIILKINPADVVSIPSDYNFAKGRAWTYFVDGEVDQDCDVLGEAPSVVKSSAQVPTAHNCAHSFQYGPEVLGYDAGYRYKRYGEEQQECPYVEDEEDDEAHEWHEAFDLGAEHAKKRVARLYKSPRK